MLLVMTYMDDLVRDQMLDTCSKNSTKLTYSIDRPENERS